MQERSYLCGVTCEMGGKNCNGYCAGDADRPGSYFVPKPKAVMWIIETKLGVISTHYPAVADMYRQRDDCIVTDYVSRRGELG